MRTSPQKSRGIAYLLLVIATVCWGGNWVVARAIALEVPSLSLVFWRTLLFAGLAFLLAPYHYAGFACVGAGVLLAAKR